MQSRHVLLEQLAMKFREVLNLYYVRLALSGIILLSLCPFEFVRRTWWAFFVVFAVEFAGRVLCFVYLREAKVGVRRRLTECGMLLLDLGALISFLPGHLIGGGRYLRLARFLRLFVLFGYWGGTFRSLWFLVSRPERKLQLWVLVVAVTLLSFVSATILAMMDVKKPELEMMDEVAPAQVAPPGLPHAPAAAAAVDRETPRFSELLWWSFRQVQDPGNLIHELEHPGILVLSILLTIGGLFLISFLIGIGTTIVEELVETSRNRPMGLKNHSILVSSNEHTHFFLEQVVDYYQKQLQRPRWMVLGGQGEDPSFVGDSAFKSIHYRHGTPYHHEDLLRVDATTAKRIVILGEPQRGDPDAATLSAVLSSRRLNPEALIYAEIHDEKNTSAIMGAGGDRTVVVPVDHLVALAMANIAVMPSAYPIFDELLTARGNEIYTYIYQPADTKPGVLGSRNAFAELFRHAYDVHDCVLLGVGVPPAAGGRGSSTTLDFIMGLGGADDFPADKPTLGIAGIGSNFECVRALARDHAKRGTKPPASHKVAELEDLPPLRQRVRTDAGAHILVCGFIGRTPLLLEHLIQFLPECSIYVMVSEQAQLESGEIALLDSGRSMRRFQEVLPAVRTGRGTFRQVTTHTYAYIDTDGVELPARIHLMVGDWTRRDVLLEEHDNGYALPRIQRMIVQSGEDGEEDPDARTVMAIMKLHSLRHLETFHDQLHPDLHLTIEMVDILKADLLEERFGKRSARMAIPIEVVPVEKIRHVLMFQSTVVPGFASIFMEVFSRRNEYLFEIEMSTPPGSADEIHFGQLLWTIYRRHRLTLIGVEVELDDGTTRSVTAPDDGPEARFRLDRIRAMHVIGYSLDD